MAGEGQPEPGSFVEVVRGMRNKEAWARYDAIAIGPGARAEDPGWFDSWDQLANANQIILFNSARDNVNPAWNNLTGPQEDFAQLLYGMWAEFLAPTSDLRELTNPFDLSFARWWTTEVPRSTYLEVEVTGVDTVLKIPANYAPSGHGTTELRVDGAGAPTLNPGNNGSPQVGQCWMWTMPLGIPATKKVQVKLEIDARIFRPLVGITNAPAFTQFAVQDPNNPLNTILIPIANRFVIRIGFIGPRFVQLRGASSQGEGG